MMRILGWMGSSLIVLGIAGCGPAGGLDEGMPEEAEYKAAPKIEFAKRKAPSKAAAKPGATGATATAAEEKKK